MWMFSDCGASSKAAANLLWVSTSPPEKVTPPPDSSAGTVVKAEFLNVKKKPGKRHCPSVRWDNVLIKESHCFTLKFTLAR
jgi:hypothetical protein